MWLHSELTDRCQAGPTVIKANKLTMLKLRTISTVNAGHPSTHVLQLFWLENKAWWRYATISCDLAEEIDIKDMGLGSQAN